MGIDNDRDKITTDLLGRWNAVLEAVGYEEKGAYSLASQPEVAKRLGHLVYNYMVSSTYDCEWEGYNEDDLVGILALVEDMSLYARATRLD